MKLLRALAFFVIFVSLSAFAEPQWVLVKTPHFTVATDAGERRGREVALRFEQMRAVFGAMFQNMKVNFPVPLQVLALRNRKELNRFAPLWNGKPVELAGFFQGGEDRNYILLDLSVEDAWPVVFHEYMHVLLNGNTPPMQPWVDEGFAEYFSTLRIVGDKGRVGEVSPGTTYLLAQEKWMPVQILFSIGHDSREYNEKGDRRSIFYAESGLAMHYLFSQRKQAQALIYSDLVLHQHANPESALRQAFGMDARQLDKALRDYFMGRMSVLLITVPGGLKETSYETQFMSEPQVLSMFADVHLHSRDYPELAMTEFQDVLKLQPDSPDAHRGLGYAYLRKNDFEKAGAEFKLAAAKGSQDARLLYYVALLAVRDNGTSADDLKQARDKLTTALSLDPEFGDAYDVLGWIEDRLGHFREAIAAAQKAVALSPREDRYSYNLAQHYLRQNSVDQAMAILGPLKNSQQPQIAMMASQQLQVLATHKRGASGTEQSAQASGTRLSVTTEKGTDDTAEVSDTITLPPVPAKFLKGIVEKVDCSQQPAAVFTIASGTAKWEMRAADRDKLVLLGTGKFSCDWHDMKVMVNYYERASGTGDLISLELSH